MASFTNPILHALFPFLLLSGKAETFGQEVRIPDPILKQRIIALGYDENGDGVIQYTEAKKVTKLYVDNLGIVSLEGINSFINLTELGCYGNKLQVLDVSGLKNLKQLYAFGNRIERLNIGDLAQLEVLYIQDNYLLSQLDVSKHTELKELNFTNNRVRKIDVSGLSKLQIIEGGNNRLETVQLKKATSLQSINLSNNPLKIPTLDIRGLTHLETFNFEGCGLRFINFSGTISLKSYRW